MPFVSRSNCHAARLNCTPALVLLHPATQVRHFQTSSGIYPSWAGPFCQRLFRLAAREEHRDEGVAVPGGDPCLSGVRKIGRKVSPNEVDCAQYLAPTAAKILLVVYCRLARRRRSCGRSLKPRSNLSFEPGQPGLVECLGGVLLHFVTKCVGVIVHPRKQPDGRLVRVGARCLPGFDPSADKAGHELSQVSARIVELFGLLVAAGEESLVEGGSACRVGCNELRDLGGDLFQPPREREALPIGNERPWVKRQFHLALDRIRTAARLSFHPPLP